MTHLQSEKTGPSGIHHACLTTAFVVGLACISASCDSSSPEDSQKLSTSVDPVLVAEVSNDQLRARLNSKANLDAIHWYVAQSGTDLDVFVMSFSGLMIATRHTGPLATTGSQTSNPNLDAFKFSENEADSKGLFLIDETLDDHEITNWPIDLDAPVWEDGSHKRYGDTMAWASYSSESPGSGGKGGIEDIRVGMSLYIFDDNAYKSALFIRYDITNIGAASIDEVFTGYYSDVDLFAKDGGNQYCGKSSNHMNQSGYDFEREILFAYTSPDPADGVLEDACYGIAAGMSYLDLSDGGIPPGIYTSRIVTRRESGDYFTRFSETLIGDPSSVILALQGLDTGGSPMINPISGEVTRFAFTGDPVSGTGWLDKRNDIKQLLSKPSFSLDSGQTKSIALVWVLANGTDFGDAISNLKSKIADIRSEHSLWDF